MGGFLLCMFINFLLLLSLFCFGGVLCLLFFQLAIIFFLIFLVYMGDERDMIVGYGCEGFH